MKFSGDSVYTKFPFMAYKPLSGYYVHAGLKKKNTKHHITSSLAVKKTINVIVRTYILALIN